MQAIQVIRQLRQSRPDLGIVVVTVFEDGDHILDAIDAGADCYLLVSTPVEALVNAVADRTQAALGAARGELEGHQIAVGNGIKDDSTISQPWGTIAVIAPGCVARRVLAQAFLARRRAAAQSVRPGK
jgi:DNA-binding response OmpR family regulator